MEQTRNATLAAEIRAEKGRQQVTGRELARRVGKPESTVARWLRGETPMSLDEIEAFAKALDVSTVDLIERAYSTDPGARPSGGRPTPSQVIPLPRSRAPRALSRVDLRPAA